jgi:hypothetical protein
VTGRSVGATYVAAALGKAQRLLAEYIAFQYAEGILKMPAYLRALPRQEACLAWIGLGSAILTVIATPVFTGPGAGLGGLAFMDVAEQARRVPGAAFFLAAGLFVVAWGYILNGAAAGPGVLWIASGLFYIFLINTVGFAIPRTSPWANLHAAAICLPVLVAAHAPLPGGHSPRLCGDAVRPGGQSARIPKECRPE